ncbi:MAG: agmatine deiminase family protein [Myxococcota bacterium]|jgi:agmatine deiminase|nr:agmatine deiminase family protein [Myxococcota bacterium]
MSSLLLFALAGTSVQAAPSDFTGEPSATRPAHHIYQVPWWEREAPERPPWLEASEPPSTPPYQLGEFDPVDAILLTAWYSNYGLGNSYIPMVEALAERNVPVYACKTYASDNMSSKSELEDAGLEDAVEWIDCDLDSIWMRDYGPFFAMDEDANQMLGDAVYYEYSENDDSYPEQAGEWLDDEVYQVPLNMEGGNFYSNGEGLCVSTNVVYRWYTGTSKEDAEQVYAERLGCDESLFLDPLSGEGTGHVDMYFTFVSHDHAIVGSYDPDVDATNAELLDEQAAILEDAGIRVSRIPMPPHEDLDGDGWEDFATFINGFFVDYGDESFFLMPWYPESYPDESDAGLVAMQEALPDHEVIPIAADELITLGGALHCVVKSMPTLQWPRPCEDVYDFNDDDPRCAVAETDEEKGFLGCACATTSPTPPSRSSMAWFGLVLAGAVLRRKGRG